MSESPDASAPRLTQRFEPALDKKLFRSLLARVRRLGEERLRNTYQTTFWFELGDPSCVVEQAALALRDRVSSLEGVVGVEWWLSRMRATDVRVDFHQDRDEKLALAGGPIRHPRWSSVLFLNAVPGGELAVTEEPVNEENPARAPDRLDLVLVAPRPNRFVVFRGDLTHGVLDARSELPTRRLPGRAPLRLAVIFNWWRARPTAVPRFSERRIYQPLALLTR